MLVHGVGRRAEPRGEWGDHLLARGGVQLDRLELLLRQRIGFVEDLGGHVQLADVVQQRRPAQVIDLGGVELHLLADHHCVRPHPLGVATGQAVVSGQHGHQLEERLGGLRRSVAEVDVIDLGELLLQLARRHAAQRQAESRGGLVGEHQRQREQRGQREQPPHRLLGDHHHQRGDGGDREPPHDADPELVGGGDPPGQHDRDDERQHDRHHEHEETNRACHPLALRPALGSAGRWRVGRAALTRRVSTPALLHGTPSTHVVAFLVACRTWAVLTQLT